jgi:transcription elongation factor
MERTIRQVTIGDRVRITAGDSFGELGTVRTLAEGPSQLYTVVLDSDAAVIHVVAERFVIVR